MKVVWLGLSMKNDFFSSFANLFLCYVQKHNNQGYSNQENPFVEGKNLSWMSFVAEDFLAAVQKLHNFYISKQTDKLFFMNFLYGIVWLAFFAYGSQPR